MCVKFGSGAADCARIGIDEASARQASVEAAMIGFIRLLFDSTDCVFDRRSADSVRGSITARGTNVASTELTMSPLWCGGRSLRGGNANASRPPATICEYARDCRDFASMP